MLEDHAICSIKDMPKNINSFILPDDIIKEMKNKIKETQRERVEKGFGLCTDKNSNFIKKGPDCTGTRCGINAGKCGIYQTHIGDYHTHPDTIAQLSIGDMVSGCDDNIECVGSALYGNIRCFVRRTDTKECLGKISPFEAEERNLNDRDQEIIRTLKSPRAIIKKGIPVLLKDMYQYEKDIDKYHANRAKLLKENYDQIDIIGKSQLAGLLK